jgi:ElaB/YqjD/DUF883 family membrane-anchored ribosome-binding protein
MMAQRGEKAAASKPSPKGEAESKSPEEIQAEIDTTREELADTVAAVAEKADVKEHAKRKAARTKEKAKSKISGTVEQATAKREELGSKAQEATPESASHAAQQAAHKVQDNPVPTAVAGGFAAGLLFGWLLGRR